jgi:mRNA-degrading endonuclease RelE of RelBE toxin-antitoxin system
MIIDQKPKFFRTYKKLKTNQLIDVNNTIQLVSENPDIGTPKTGDLLGMRIYKFRMTKQPILLAYDWDAIGNTITLLALGPHENFYRDLKG